MSSPGRVTASRASSGSSGRPTFLAKSFPVPSGTTPSAALGGPSSIKPDTTS